MRRFLADTFELVMLSTIAGVLAEIAIARLTLERTLRIRLAAFPLMLRTRRPYRLCGDWLFSPKTSLAVFPACDKRPSRRQVISDASRRSCAP
ncbi:L-alanine exporter AlaE [Mesorhizobium sp. 1B3]|uniref:L-alanine exporter AlaE n=1 Tax=Mesorhizobium sp. 1B3 TaxID=3243599 RepID=UPI003D99CB1F